MLCEEFVQRPEGRQTGEGPITTGAKILVPSCEARQFAGGAPCFSDGGIHTGPDSGIGVRNGDPFQQAPPKNMVPLPQSRVTND